MLFKGSLVTLYVVYDDHFMVRSSLLEHDLANSTQLLRNLTGFAMMLIILCSNITALHIVYDDDIVIIDNDEEGITKLQHDLFQHFQTKDLG